MASFVPKLEWNEITVLGDITSGSPVITAMPSVGNVIVGMRIDHPGFSSDAVVLSKTSNSVTMDQNALSSWGPATTITFTEFVIMDYPCPIDTVESTKAVNQISSSISGVRQIQTNYLEAKIDQEYRNLTPAKFALLEDRFFKAWAVYGRDFKLFESYEVASYRTYELDTMDFDPARVFPKNNDFLSKVKFRFRRVL